MSSQTTQRDMTTLSERLSEYEGQFYYGGMQALLRLILDASRRDRADGLRSGVLVTGYPGSPIAGLDLALERAGTLADEHHIRHIPAAAEERAVTALMGSQMLDSFPHPEYDGVVGFWYGKGPGIDRSGDALKHGNFAGTSKHGAVVVLSGEDHEAQSSTMPFQQDYAFQSAGIPVLSPASVAEFGLVGLHAVALSRYSGCWVALKLVTALCDAGAAYPVAPNAPRIVTPDLRIGDKPFVKRADFTFFPGRNIDIERHLYRERHAAVIAYARANHLDSVAIAGDHDRVGIISAGKPWADLRQALVDTGVSDDDLRAAGIRVAKLTLTYPVDAEFVRKFADGLDEVLVVEEKRGVIEGQVKESLCGSARSVRVLGKTDETGAPWLPVEGGMDTDQLVELLGPRIAAWLGGSTGIEARLTQIAVVRARRYEQHILRTPNYCSGCPHSLSTQLPEGEIAWGSPGCHSFASILEQPHRHVEAMTQYGGEGLPWIGLAPFTDKQHMVQNVGDGSLWHSSYDNIRACVAAGVNITFKLLYNGVVANTGAQQAPGAKSVPDVARLLALEGVARIALVTKRPHQYRRIALPGQVSVHSQRDVIDVQRELAAVTGVTVMVYDESCANERRRRQNRGTLERSDRHVYINERVCERCGDCGKKSNCMSLQKIDTELGQKTQIHSSSCNQDFSCVSGDCPSFVVVDVKHGTGYARPSALRFDMDLPEPKMVDLSAVYRIYSPGVGGTGVITVNAILAVAASLDGLEVASYDQTGAAQKWGPVLSSLTIAPAGTALPASKVGVAQADLLLGLDLVAAAEPENLDRADPSRTAAVLDTTLFPTGEMVRDVWVRPDTDGMLSMITRYTRPDYTHALPAREIAESAFGDFMMTNLVVVGAAWQAGLVPISRQRIEQAITLNGVAVQNNLAAFRLGRAWIADPAAVQRALIPGRRPTTDLREAALGGMSSSKKRAYERLRQGTEPLDENTRELVDSRLADLVDYQDATYAARYLDAVLTVNRAEMAQVADQAITRAFATNLHKLMAYKDEYEVARLYLQVDFGDQINSAFEAPQRVSYQLHPPVLRALGVDRKISLGPWFRPGLRTLRAMRRLRATPFDIFGGATVRRTERELVDWYVRLVDDALSRTRPGDAGSSNTVQSIAEIPDRIRGYEQIKLDNIATAKEEAGELLARLERRPLPLVLASGSPVDQP